MSILVPAKSRKQSRTYWINGAIVLVGVLQIVLDSGQLAAVPDVAIWVGMAIAIANLILREFTKQPVGEPGELVEVPAASPGEPKA